MEDFSSFFGNRQLDKIEIPGQYGLSYSDPAKTKFVSIAGFKPQATVFASLRKPVRITMIGDDGKNYDFIVKSGEDLRQDQRVQQVFRFCNSVCKSGTYLSLKLIYRKLCIVSNATLSVSFFRIGQLYCHTYF